MSLVKGFKKKEWQLLLLLLSHFSHVRLCVTPEMAAHQAPPSLGFSRQEHWSGLPFPSPVHESEKWKWSCSVVSDPQRPHGLQPSRLLRPWDFPGKSTGVRCHRLLRRMAVVLPKAVYRFNTIHPQNPLGLFFAGIKITILKFIWNFKGLQIAKTISKKNSVGGLTLSDCKIYYQATVTEYFHDSRSFLLTPWQLVTLSSPTQATPGLLFVIV